MLCDLASAGSEREGGSLLGNDRRNRAEPESVSSEKQAVATVCSAIGTHDLTRKHINVYEHVLSMAKI